ncbi:MAG: hypothetical protein R3202_05965 [Candidatus Competibacterales bacterium]|nr:hypothetical protein [Candidatus Competibacterales bacterium]
MSESIEQRRRILMERLRRTQCDLRELERQLNELERDPAPAPPPETPMPIGAG